MTPRTTKPARREPGKRYERLKEEDHHRMKKQEMASQGGENPGPGKKTPYMVEDPRDRNPQSLTLYSPRDQTLQEALAKVVLGALYAGLSGDEAFWRSGEEQRRISDPVRALRKMEVDPRVRAWIHDHFHRQGPVLEAAVAQMTLAVQQFQSDPQACGPCWPYCKPP